MNKALHSPYVAIGAALFVVLEIALIMFVDEPLSRYLRTVDIEHHQLIDFFRSWTDLGKSFWYLWPSGIGVLVCFGLIRWTKIDKVKRAQLRRLLPATRD